MTKDTVTASSPGNIFFFGEFAVIYNKPCIIASVDRKTTVTANMRTDDKVIIESAAFGSATAVLGNTLHTYESKASELYPLLDFISDIVPKLKITQGLTMKITSDIPVNSGMSSSTAVFCSILKALTNLSGKNIDNRDYFDWIYPHQVKIHGGKASGSEIVSSSVGGFNIVKKKQDKITFNSLGTQNFSVVIADTKVSAPTALTVGYHLPSMEARFPSKVRGIFKNIEKLTIDAKTAIQNNDLEEIGHLMNENQTLLSKLGMSHPKLDDCIYTSLAAGALGAKLSGGGWGGIMVALCYPKDQDKIMNALKETGADVIMSKIGVEGAKIE
ncbi:MAG: mevalonate kinase [Candidatus Nanohalarchaeota archaeon]|nr:MAG: mevalonate kinase [Candidatus Nanohaloarchaeota archaeon]